MTYDELLKQYNKMSSRLRLYYILYNESTSETIKIKIEKRVHNLMYARNEIIKQMTEMENNNDPIHV